MQPNNGPTQEGMLKYMEEASRIVAGWPKWKREVLGNPDYYERMSVTEQIKTGLEQAIDITSQKNRPLKKGDIASFTDGTEVYITGQTEAGEYLTYIRLTDGVEGSAYPPSLSLVPYSDLHTVQLQALHIKAVADRLNKIAYELMQRAARHDFSKWQREELLPLMSVQPAYNKSSYGTSEWHTLREKIQPAIQHHQQLNDHHMENHADGIRSMDLIQILEMLADWSAASLRDTNSNLEENLRRTAQRYGWSDDLTQVILNTIQRGYL